MTRDQYEELTYMGNLSRTDYSNLGGLKSKKDELEIN